MSVKRDFGKLASFGSAAAANGAGLTVTDKDRVVYLDPTKDVLYEPSENVRDQGVMDTNLDSLVSLRLTLDGEGQLQPIRVYPLPQAKLDPSCPSMKYGVAYGHRRLLACRLTSADSPLVGDQPKRVMALVDTDWLTKGGSYRIRCQIQENKNRLDLNFVEEGEALRRFRAELSQEEDRAVPQRELIEIFGIPEKTVGYLLQAAEFEDLAKEACNRKILTDLDSLVTFDAICKVNAAFARAVYASLEDRDAPRTRTMIRAAKTFIETNPSYSVDAAVWQWPDVVMQTPAPKVSVTAAKPSEVRVTDQQPKEIVKDAAPGGLGAGTPDAAPGEREVVDLAFPQPALSNDGATPLPSVQTTPQTTVVHAARNASAVVVVVSFRMGEEATLEFNGELLLDRPAKTPNLASVMYINDGREEIVEVPLRLVSLVSINH